MIADFTITVYYADKPRGVQIKIHDNVAALRSAATKYTQQWYSRKQKQKNKGEFATTLGICHRFYMMNDPVCAIVRLAPPNIGVGILAHELTHAAVHILEIEDQFKGTPLTCENDEQFAWVLGELVRCAVNMMYEKGVWTEAVS